MTINRSLFGRLSKNKILQNVWIYKMTHLTYLFGLKFSKKYVLVTSSSVSLTQVRKQTNEKMVLEALAPKCVQFSIVWILCFIFQTLKPFEIWCFSIYPTRRLTTMAKKTWWSWNSKGNRMWNKNKFQPVT